MLPLTSLQCVGSGGITSAPEMFMRKMNEVLDSLEGTFAYMDDILVYGKDREEHNKRLECVMKRLREVDLKLNKEKCVFAQSELKFLGHKVTKSLTDHKPLVMLINEKDLD